MFKVVIDTNQFVSSVIIKQGPSAQLLQAWREHYYILIISKGILEEIKRALEYPHIIKKYPLNKQDIEAFIRLIEHEAIILADSIQLDVIKDDPSDNKVLACALEVVADYIVSGDKHLLNLHQYENIPIVTVQEFLKIIGYKT